MRETAPVVAYASIVLLGAALGGVVYMGRRAGPSTPPGTAPAASAPPSSAQGSAASPTSTPSTGESLAFVPSADLTPEEQGMLERLNQVRANPPAFFDDWKKTLAEQKSRRLPCEEPDSMLDPLKAYAPRMPLAANQQLTNAARAHAKDEQTRGFMAHVNPDGIGSNQRVIAAGYPLPIGAHLGGFTYSAEKDAVNTEAIYKSAGRSSYGPETWPQAIDTLIVDACIPSRGHRDHMLGVGGTSPIEPEIGVGGITGGKSEQHVVIETATRNDGNFYVLGVVYRDTDGDNHYDIGEGVSGVQVNLAAAGVTTKTGPGGGYALPVKDGVSGDVTTGSGASKPFAIAGANVKVDIIVP